MLYRLKNSFLDFVLVLIIALFLVRSGLPQYIKYALFPLVLFAGFIALVKFFRGNNILDKQRDVLTYLWLPLLLSLIYFISFSIFPYKQQAFIKDFVNFLVVLVFSLSLFILVNNRQKLKFIIDNFIDLAIFLSVVFALGGIVKLFLQLKGVYLNFLKVEGFGYPLGTSLSVDDNFYSLVGFVSVIFIIKKLSRKISITSSIMYQLSLFILIGSSILSTSRRGTIIALLLIILLLVNTLISGFSKQNILKRIRNNSIIPIIMSVGTCIVWFYFLIGMDSIKRNQWLAESFFDKHETEFFINSQVLSIRSILHGNENYITVKDEIWNTSFDSRFPYTGWTEGNYELVENLSALGLNEVPSDAKGAMINNRSTSFSSKNDAYYYSILYKGVTSKGKRYLASVYCRVSNDFDGDQVRISASSKLNGLIYWDYDLSRKGVWQKLQVSFYSDSGNYKVLFYVIKHGSNSLDSLMGNVIFAYPELYVLENNPKNPLTWSDFNYEDEFPLIGKGSEAIPKGTIGSKYSDKTIARKGKEKSYINNIIGKVKFDDKKNRVIVSTFAYVSNDFSGDEVRIWASGDFFGHRASYYDLSKKGTWQKLSLMNWGNVNDSIKYCLFFINPNGIDFKNLKGYVVFAYPTIEKIDFNSNNPETYASGLFDIEKTLKENNSNIVPKIAVGCKYTKKEKGRIWKEACHSTTQYWSLPVSKGDSVFASIYCYVSPDFNGDDVRVDIRGDSRAVARYNLKKKGEWVKLTARGVAEKDGIAGGYYLFLKRNASDFSDLKGHVTFAYPELIVKPAKVFQIESKKKLTESSIGMGMLSLLEDSMTDSISEFELKMPEDRFAGPRLDRWRYALYIFRHDYGWWQKLIGGGFGYTKKFAKEFNSKNDYDYPHNPFLSVLLYSGIVGLIFYLWFFVKSLYLYYKYRKAYWVLGVAYIITYFFAFFSSNSPFEPGFLGVLSFLPFIIHYVYSKEQIEQCQKEH